MSDTQGQGQNQDRGQGNGQNSSWQLNKRVDISTFIGLCGVVVTIGVTAIVAHHRLGVLEDNFREYQVRVDDRVKVIENTFRQQEREIAQRDTTVREVLTELRVTVEHLRVTVSEFRTALGRIEMRSRDPRDSNYPPN